MFPVSLLPFVWQRISGAYCFVTSVLKQTFCEDQTENCVHFTQYFMESTEKQFML